MADKALRIIVKVLAYTFVLLLLVYLFVQMRHMGYEIFSDDAKDTEAAAVEMVLTVSKGEGLLEIGKELARGEIIDNPYFFAAAMRCSEGYENIQPGEYVVNSAQKPSEILAVIAHKEDQIP